MEVTGAFGEWFPEICGVPRKFQGSMRLESNSYQIVRTSPMLVQNWIKKPQVYEITTVEYRLMTSIFSSQFQRLIQALELGKEKIGWKSHQQTIHQSTEIHVLLKSTYNFWNFYAPAEELSGVGKELKFQCSKNFTSSPFRLRASSIFLRTNDNYLIGLSDKMAEREF